MRAARRGGATAGPFRCIAGRGCPRGPHTHARAPAHRRCIGEFLDNSDCPILVFYGDNVSVSNAVPKVLTGKSKGLLFLKLQSSTLDESSMGADVVMLELTRNALADLEGLLEEVYRPLLSNPANQEGWGEVASKETVDKLHNFLAATTITLGHTRGETLLPLPSMDGLQETTGADGRVGFLVTAASKERIHLLEGVRAAAAVRSRLPPRQASHPPPWPQAVITWTKQVKAVLRQDPESLLKMGLHPTPDQEIQFWRNKAANLNSIFDQLQVRHLHRLRRLRDLPAPDPPRGAERERAPGPALSGRAQEHLLHTVRQAVQGGVSGTSGGQRQRQVPVHAGGTVRQVRAAPRPRRWIGPASPHWTG